MLRLIILPIALLGCEYKLDQRSLETIQSPVKNTSSGADQNPEKPSTLLTDIYYQTPQILELKVAEGNVIYYTTDGSTPTTDSNRYTGPITIDQSLTVKAISVSKSGAVSDVVTIPFVISSSLPVAEASVGGGTYNNLVEVTLTSPVAGAAIYYTTDGVTAPSNAATLYTAPIKIFEDTKLRWISIKATWDDSPEGSAEYKFSVDLTVPQLSGTAHSSSVTATSFTLNWPVATDYTTDTTDIEYFVCTGVNAADIDTVGECLGETEIMAFTKNVTSYAVTSLNPSTSYYYAVVARNSRGNTSIYPVISVTTTADTQGPTISTAAINKSLITKNGLTLDWTAATDNVTSATDLEYMVCSSTVSLADLNTVQKCLNANEEMAFTANTTTAAIVSKSPGTTYYFNVVVKDDAGNRSLYTAISATTLNDDVPPTIGTFNAVTGVTQSGFTLSWTEATDNIDAQSSLEYYVCSGASAAAIDTIQKCLDTDINTRELNWTAGQNSLVVTGKKANTSYYITIVVRDLDGNTALYNSISQTTGPDITPPTKSSSTISISNVSATGLTLNWTKASDETSAVADLEYLVCSSTSTITTINDCESATIEENYTADINTATITGKDPETTYYFNVIVRDEAGNQTLYTSASQQTQADTTPPTPGSYSATTNITDVAFTLNWTVGIDNATSSANLEYYVCSAATAAEIDTPVKCTGKTQEMNWTANSTSYNVTGKTAGTIYYLNVLVRDAKGNVAAYGTIDVTTSAVPPVKDWEVPEDISDAVMTDSSYAIYNVKTALADNGDAAIAWKGSNGIYVSIRRGGVWTHPNINGQLAESSSSTSLYDFKMNNNGHILVSYITSGRLYKAEFNGTTWSQPSSVNDYIATNAFRVLVAIANNGHKVIVWNENVAGTMTGIYVAEDRSGSWSFPSVPDDSFMFSGYSAALNSIAINSSGDTIVGITQSQGATSHTCPIYYRNSAWTKPANTSECFSPNENGLQFMASKVAVSETGHMFAAYENNNHFCFSEFNGTTWSHPASSAACITVAPDIGFYNYLVSVNYNNLNDVFMIWSQWEVAGHLFYSYRIGGNWTHPTSNADEISTFNYGEVATAVSVYGDVTIIQTPYLSDPVSAITWDKNDWSTPIPKSTALTENFTPTGISVSLNTSINAGGQSLMAWTRDDGSFTYLFFAEYK